MVKKQTRRIPRQPAEQAAPKERTRRARPQPKRERTGPPAPADTPEASGGVDWLNLASLLVFLAVVLWIGWDGYRQHRRTAARIAEANAAVAANDAGRLDASRRALLDAQAALLREAATPAAVAMGFLHGSGVSLDRQLATVYRNLGQWHADRQEPGPATRAYALALAYDPNLDGVAQALAQECFFAGAWGLGLRACALGRAAEGDRLEHFERLFRKRLATDDHAPAR
ncbi:MAG: hypothetical protein ACOCX4_08145 [Planctomycetota bacterium]